MLLSIFSAQAFVFPECVFRCAVTLAVASRPVPRA